MRGFRETILRPELSGGQMLERYWRSGSCSQRKPGINKVKPPAITETGSPSTGLEDQSAGGFGQFAAVRRFADPDTSGKQRIGMQAWHVAGMHDEGDMILHEPRHDGLA